MSQIAETTENTGGNLEGWQTGDALPEEVVPDFGRELPDRNQMVRQGSSTDLQQDEENALAGQVRLVASMQQVCRWLKYESYNYVT